MARCRTFVQSVALWGLVFILPFYQAMAAPVCSQVLLAPTMDIEATIQHLAPLKMQIDLNHSKGAEDAATKVLSAEFSRKWNEILSTSQRSPDVLKELLRHHILKLQNQEHVKVKKEQDERHAEREAVEAYLPESRKSVILPMPMREYKHSLNPRMVFIEYFADSKTLLMADREGHLLKSETGVLSPTVKSGIQGAYGRIPERNEIVHVSEAGKVLILSSVGQVTKVLGEIPTERIKKLKNALGDSNIVVNQTGNRFALIGNNDVIFFDAADGSSWSLSDKRVQLNGPIQKVIFDNEYEAMVYSLNSDRNIDMLLADLKKKDTDVVEPLEMLNEVVGRNRNQETIQITDEMDANGRTRFQVNSYSLSNNATKNLFSLPITVNYIPMIYAQEIPNSNLLLLNRFWKGENNLEIYDLQKQKAVHAFEEYNLPRATTGRKVDIIGVTFTQDHTRAFILYREETTQNGQALEIYKLDQWVLPALDI